MQLDTTGVIRTATALSNEDLRRRLEVLAGRQREATVELIAHLAELDRRRLYVTEGYSSLSGYCTDALRLSEHAAQDRIEAARACRRFPTILDGLASGELNLSTVRLIAPHLRPDNHQEVLTQASGRRKRELEELVARLVPRADVVASIRRLPVAIRPTAANPSAAVVGADPDGTDSNVQTLPKLRPVVAPLAPERYPIQFTVGRETHENLRRAQDLLRREIPDGDPEAFFERALALLLEDILRKKFAVTSKPRPGGRVSPGARHVPAEVRRAVWLRDGGQCGFIAHDGRRCRERAFLEFHRLEPYGIAGETTVESVTLRCRTHNVPEAELVSGPFDPVVRESAEAYGDGDVGESARRRGLDYRCLLSPRAKIEAT
jgi:uncharacterized protein DUF222